MIIFTKFISINPFSFSSIGLSYPLLNLVNSNYHQHHHKYHYHLSCSYIVHHASWSWLRIRSWNYHNHESGHHQIKYITINIMKTKIVIIIINHFNQTSSRLQVQLQVQRQSSINSNEWNDTFMTSHGKPMGPMQYQIMHHLIFMASSLWVSELFLTLSDKIDNLFTISIEQIQNLQFYK